MLVLIKILIESFLSAIRELWVNKLRAFLTLLGISIGIFCVISIFSAVDSLESNLRASLDKLGSNVIYIGKWPWAFNHEYAWWKYINRPHGNYNEMGILEQKLPNAAATGIFLNVNNRVLKYKDRSVDNANIIAVSQRYDEFQNLEFQAGRFFSASESSGGEPIVILGSAIKDEMFQENEDPIGKQISLMDSKVTVVGVFTKQGSSIINNSTDNLVMLPYLFGVKHVNVDGYGVEPTIMVKAKDKVSNEEIKDEIRSVLRNLRHLGPKEDDNFAMNEMSLISDQISSIFGVLDLVGLIIGGFAILVGGFGIANIMFVSVKERTNIIGIKKALGAKNYFILLEFLIESIVLSIIGGLIGLLFVSLLLLALNSGDGFKFVLSSHNILLGVCISGAIGILSGFIPALSAARLNPVDAIRFK